MDCVARTCEHPNVSRVLRLPVCAFALCGILAVGCESTLPPAPAAPSTVAVSLVRANVDQARVLDQQGVRAFQAGRYRDAIFYFRASRRLGGPPSELWNAARAHEKLDEAELAAAAIDDYLADSAIAADERAEGIREKARLAARPSLLTVLTDPPGARVKVDSRSVGTTPLSTEISPGTHTVKLTHTSTSSTVPIEVTVEARYGRALLVERSLRK